MQTQEEPQKPKFKYQYDLINFLFVALIFWAIYEPTVRNIVFWMILVLNSLVLIFGAIALKNQQIETSHYLNFLTKLALVVSVLVAFFKPSWGSNICAILFVLQLFQAAIGYYQNHLKIVRRTEERKPKH
jgi:uncharacterized membrane protein